MVCAASTRFYRPRRPRDSPVHQVLAEHFDEFEQVYAERYQRRYGGFRPAIRKAVDAFLACGDLHQGFARIRCPDCQHEMFVGFSCRKRCVCPSYHRKRAILMGMHIAEEEQPSTKPSRASSAGR